MHTETTVHSGLDTMLRPLRSGTYTITGQGDISTCLITEDPETGELLVVMHGRGHLVNDLAPDVQLTRLNNLTTAPPLGELKFIENVLRGAARHRRALAQVEAVLAEHLGCERGDGSPVWDGISAAVRDGLGTAVDLLDLVGE